jgi:hypothetical protein
MQNKYNISETFDNFKIEEKIEKNQKLIMKIENTVSSFDDITKPRKYRKLKINKKKWIIY